MKRLQFLHQNSVGSAEVPLPRLAPVVDVHRHARVLEVVVMHRVFPPAADEDPIIAIDKHVPGRLCAADLVIKVDGNSKSRDVPRWRQPADVAEDVAAQHTPTLGKAPALPHK